MGKRRTCTSNLYPPVVPEEELLLLELKLGTLSVSQKAGQACHFEPC